MKITLMYVLICMFCVKIKDASYVMTVYIIALLREIGHIGVVIFKIDDYERLQDKIQWGRSVGSSFIG